MRPSDPAARTPTVHPFAPRGVTAGNTNPQQRLLDTVLNNMSQGVLMFAPDTRLIFCNRRYTEIYGLPPEAACAGVTLRQLIERRMAVNMFSGDPDEYITDLLSRIARGKTTDDTVNLSDGPVILIVNKPMAGGGWLATHEDITERRRAEEKIAHMARHDALTDLPNRVLLHERLEHELKRVKRGECLAVLCLDLDHFKSVNDTLGHPIGDELLKVVADRLRHCTREPDTIARLGGDEFAIIMTAMGQPSDAATLSRRVRDSVTKPYDLDGHRVVIDISHRHLHRAARCNRRRPAFEERGYGAVWRQGRRPRRVPVFRAGDGCAHATAP